MPVAHLEDSLAIPWIVKGEFLSFTVIDGQDSLRFWSFSRVIRRIGPTKSFSSATLGSIRCSSGEAFLFATEDLWIAVSALHLTFRL